MTTIVYKDGLIAYDSRATNNGVIITDDFNKRIEKNDLIFFITGIVDNFDEIIDAYVNNIPIKPWSNMFVVDNGEVFIFSTGDDEGPYRCMANLFDRGYAIGSGEQFAMAALDLGCNAKEAVKVAAKRDVYTGGRVRTYKVT